MKGRGTRTFERLDIATGNWHSVPFEELRPMDIFRIYDDGVRVMGKDSHTAWEATSVPYRDAGNGLEFTISCRGLGPTYLEVGEIIVRR